MIKFNMRVTSVTIDIILLIFILSIPFIVNFLLRKLSFFCKKVLENFNERRQRCLAIKRLSCSLFLFMKKQMTVKFFCANLLHSRYLHALLILLRRCMTQDQVHSSFILPYFLCSLF